ncbi:MAG: CinA family protein [Bacilli bacterium]
MISKESVVKRLIDLNLTISTMESLTGGLVSQVITSFPGSSKTYKGSIISYSNEIKEQFGIQKSTIEKFGVVSSEVSKEMAISICNLLNTDVGISFTGNAGPDVLEGKEVGLVYSSIRIKNHVYSYRCQFTGNRNSIRMQCCNFAFTALDGLLTRTYGPAKEVEKILKKEKKKKSKKEKN